MISTAAVPDGTSDYEVRTWNQMTQVTGSNYVLYLRASSDALHSVNVTQGSYYAVVFTPNTNSNGVQSGALTLYKRVGGTLTQLATTVAPWRSNTEVRAVVSGSAILVYVMGERYLTVTDSDLTTGKGGFGGYGFVGYNGVIQCQLGPLDRNAPSTPSGTSAYTTALANTVDIQWGGVADDANGVGVYSYQVFRDGNYLAEVYGTGFSDTTVAASSSYSYLIKAVDRHNNVSPGLTLAVTTAPTGSIEPRRVGVRGDGSYYGGAGEQLDMRSGNLNYSIPLVKAQSRGWGLPLGLSYNSQNWRRDATTWRFGRDIGYGFGWRLMAGSLTPVFSNALSAHHWLFTDSTGAEYRLNVNTNGVWTSTEGTYMTYVEGSGRLYFNNGTFWQMDCVSGGVEDDAGARYPTRIQDSNGNYIALRYLTGIDAVYANSSGRISQVEDVRVGSGAATFTFTYNTDAIPHLTGITNSINTAENYTFAYSTAAGLWSPFSGGSQFGTAQMLQTVTQTGTSLSHTFEYGGNAAGELTKVIMPYGGELRWTHTEFAFSGARTVREVTSRQLVMSSGATPLTYGISHPGGDSSYSTRSQAVLSDASGIGDRVWNFFTTTGTTNGLVSSYQQRHTGAVVKRQQDYTWSADPAGRPYIGAVLSTVDPGQSYVKQSKTEQTLDVYGNLTQRKEYAFGNLVTPAKTYTNTYLSTSTYLNAYLRNRVLTSTLTDGTNTVTLASMVYDSGGPAGLPTTPGQWDSPLSPRGNATQVSVPGRQRNYNYDGTGTVSKVTDEMGRYVEMTNGQSSDYARPSTITPNGNTAMAETSTWNSFLGLSQSTGANGETSSVTYDSNARPTSTTSADGAVTTFAYTNSPPTVKATTNNKWVKSTMDGFGRTVKTESGYGTTTVSVSEVQYAACACSPLGKLKQKSQPYAPGGTVYWTVYSYDGVGRTVSVVLPNNSGTTTYSYTGNTVTVTDPAGKWKTYESDAFGNVTKTTEPNPAGGSWDTTYSYNLTGQMTQTQMTRGSVTQTRTWNYNLTTGRLTSETQPESGTTSFTYNSDGTLYSRTAGNGKTLTFSYDSYGRLGSVSGGDACSAKSFYYDNSTPDSTPTTNGVGRPSATSSGGYGCSTLPYPYVEEYNYTPSGRLSSKYAYLMKYDELGNLVSTPPVNGNYWWDNEGKMTTSWVQLNGSTINSYNYDYDAMGRMDRMYDNMSYSYVVGGTSYNTASQVTSISHGGLSESRQYNALGQMTRLTVAGQFDLEYRFPATTNNGQITSMKNWTTGEEVNYSYDSLGRLTDAATTGPEWGLHFTYDGFGNKSGQSVTKGSGPAMSVAVDANNRVVGHSYDGAGNTTAMPGISSMVWDDWGRLKSATPDAYMYGPDDLRVYRNGTIYFRGIDGQVVGAFTFDVNNFTLTTQTTTKYFDGKEVGRKEDRLGTVQNGSRFFPYGEEVPATTQDKRKFATYTRDSGTNLDYAMARYYSSSVGRFVSADRARRKSVSDSATGNSYAYVHGDPINFIDRNGLATCEVAGQTVSLFPALYNIETYCRSIAGSIPRYFTNLGFFNDDANNIAYAESTGGRAIDLEEFENFQLLLNESITRVEGYLGLKPLCADAFDSPLSAARVARRIGLEDLGIPQVNAAGLPVQGTRDGWAATVEGGNINLNRRINWTSPSYTRAMVDGKYTLWTAWDFSKYVAGNAKVAQTPEPGQVMDIVILHELSHVYGALGDPDLNSAIEPRLFKDCVLAPRPQAMFYLDWPPIIVQR
ncbi:MAG: hypothetical protein HY820_41200 [Acidobacteria bacterium]|nr:hypothetical protein [Acidobacteriota bacterium]